MPVGQDDHGLVRPVGAAVGAVQDGAAAVFQIEQIAAAGKGAERIDGGLGKAAGVAAKIRHPQPDLTVIRYDAVAEIGACL